MLDKDIRSALKAKYLKKYAIDNSSKIVDEMGVCAEDSRIDVAVINGHFHGYEIKSNSDSLSRLASQLDDYVKVFDYLTFVVGNKHTSNVLKLVPSWCGLVEAKQVNQVTILKYIQKPKINKDTNALSIAQLLWKDECIHLLKTRMIKGLSGKSRIELWKLVSEKIPKKELSLVVRTMLKSREAWRESDPHTFPCADC